MQVGLLGPLLVEVDHAAVAIAAPKHRAVLSLLALRASGAVHVVELTDALWGDRPPASATKAIQIYVSALRRVLPDGVIETIPYGYRLALSRDDIDTEAFGRDLTNGRARLEGGDVTVAVGLLRRGLGRWRGQPLVDLAAHPIGRAEAAQLEEQRRLGVEDLGQARLALGDHAAVVGDLEAAVAAEPLRERRWAQLMLALYRAGRQADALRAYSRLRATLGDDLGIEPSRELVALERAILLQSPDLILPETLALTTGPSTTKSQKGTPDGLPNGRAPFPESRDPGIVTFLYSAPDTATAQQAMQSEVSGSTSSIDAAVLHDELLGEVVARHGGVSFRRPGDGLGAWFPAVTEAVAAAAEAQVHFERRNDGTNGALRARMAVHTAEARLQGGSYYGPGLHLVARLHQAAHGGQVLLSAQSVGLLEGQPEGAVDDLGLWSFPDFPRPVRVYQLRYPDYADAGRFPRLRFGRPASGVIPVVRTSIIGRESETTGVISALEGSHVVTIAGPGGVGKTRLALEVAAACREDYPDGVWFADLASVSTGTEVAERVAATVGVELSAGVDPQVLLADSLRFDRMLLVLDNCEQVVASVHDLIEVVAASGTETRFLLTSRTPVFTASERVVRLGPLALPTTATPVGVDSPAVRLLLERALSAGASLDRADPALGQIAIKADGIPLALELAARRLPSMTPSDLAARMDDRLDILTASSGGGQRRHRNLRATVEWSYDLLDPDQQALFLALSVCEAGWTLEAAEHLAGSVGLCRPDAARVVADLVDKSLVSVAPGQGETARYKLLETLREFGLQRLARIGTRSTVEAWHARYYVELVQLAASESRGPGEAAAAVRIASEFDNVRTAVHWLQANSGWDLLQGMMGALADELILRERFEIGRWASELAGDQRVGDHPVRAQASAMAGNFALIEGRIAEGVALTRRSLQAGLAGSGVWIAHNTMVLMGAAGVVTDLVPHHLAVLVGLSDASGDPMGLALSLFDQALIASLGDHPGSGLEAATQLVGVGRSAQNPTITAMGLLSVGRALASTAPDQARAPLHDALDLAVSVGGHNIAGQARRAIVELDGTGADISRVRTGLRDLLSMLGRAGDRGQQLMTVLALLRPLLSIDAADLAVILATGLGATPLGGADSRRIALDEGASRLTTDEFNEAVEKGRAIVSPTELVTFAFRELTALVGAER